MMNGFRLWPDPDEELAAGDTRRFVVKHPDGQREPMRVDILPAEDGRMAVAVILLSILFMCFTAYTIAVQRTMQALDLFRPDEADKPVEIRSKQLILFHIYLRKLNAAFALGIAVYLITSRASTWHHGVGIILLSCLGSFLVASARRLRPGSGEMIAVLVAELQRQREWYRMSRNTARLRAAETLLLRVQTAHKGWMPSRKIL
jgi:hypothetical protein